jgi:hypothetical protein
MENGRLELDGRCPPDATNAPAQTNGAVSKKRRRRTWRPSAKTRLRTLDELDQRTHAAIRAKQLVSSLVVDLGGSEQVTVAQHELIQRAAILGALASDLEVAWLRKEPVEINEYLAAVNAQRRVLVSLGLERRARDVSTSLGSILRNGHRNEAAP